MSRSLLLTLVVATGCTFNVSSFSQPVTSQAPEVPAHLTADLSHMDHFSGLDVVVRGQPDATRALATVRIGGLLGSSGDVMAVLNGVHVDWPVSASDPTTRGLTIRYDGPASETVWAEGVSLALPSATTLDLSLGGASIDVDGMSAAMRIVTGSGSIHVRNAGDFVLEADSGSIDVSGHGGTASCTSGSIGLSASSAVVAQASSGSIDGTFGGGGSMMTTSGSVRVTLTSALDQDLTLSATSGSIQLVVPAGTAMHVETHTGSGSSFVSVGGVDSSDDFTGDVNGGGFTVRATTSSGSIHVVEM